MALTDADYLSSIVGGLFFRVSHCTKPLCLCHFPKPMSKRYSKPWRAVARRYQKYGSVPELAVKLRRVERAATQARKGRNPLTGEDIMIKAKPARKVIRALPLKALKDVLA